LNQFVSNPFKTLVVVDHVPSKLLLVSSMVSWNEFVESFGSTSNFNEDMSRFQNAVLLFRSDQILTISNMNDWDCDMLVINNLSDALI